MTSSLVLSGLYCVKANALAANAGLAKALLVAALVAWLTLVAEKSRWLTAAMTAALVAWLTFISQLAGRLASGSD